ncbi:MAG: hypothetical protein HY706_02685 [Candidatus Hydrogenedentes bacterium]|nr:hypothetical protein [Candidatus Hydrogenedentota bacterium]
MPSRNLELLIHSVRSNLERIVAQLDAFAVAHLKKNTEQITDEEYVHLMELPEVVDLVAQYEREEKHLEILEEEATREARDTTSLLAQSELDEDIPGAD